jgi:Amt family ammonium transporter
VAVAVGAFGLSYVLFVVVNSLIPMRVTSKQEERGLDDSQHGEKLH